MEEKDLEEVMDIFERIYYMGNPVDIVKLLEILEEYGFNFDFKSFHDYYHDLLKGLHLIKKRSYKDFKIKILQFLYNKVGFENALFYIYDPNLFKWYREVQGSFEIKNTRGSINYDDIASPEEFVETWADQYIDEIQKLQKNPEDIES